MATDHNAPKRQQIKGGAKEQGDNGEKAHDDRFLGVKFLLQSKA